MLNRLRYCEGHQAMIPLEKFHIPVKGKPWRRKNCDDCRNADNARGNRIRRALKNPDDFLSCADCDEVFSKFVHGRPLLNGVPRLKTECPFCKSKELEQFI